jgi:hypothetical protein
VHIFIDEAGSAGETCTGAGMFAVGALIIAESKWDKLRKAYTCIRPRLRQEKERSKNESWTSRRRPRWFSCCGGMRHSERELVGKLWRFKNISLSTPQSGRYERQLGATYASSRSEHRSR